jgi:hypothetical protein
LPTGFFFLSTDDLTWYNLTVTVDNTSSVQSITLHRQGDYFALYPVPLWKGHLVGQEMTPEEAAQTPLQRVEDRPPAPMIELGPAPEGPRPTMATLARALAENQKPPPPSPCSEEADCHLSEEEEPEEEEAAGVQATQQQAESPQPEPPQLVAVDAKEEEPAAKKKKEGAEEEQPPGPTTRRRKESVKGAATTTKKTEASSQTAATD